MKKEMMSFLVLVSIGILSRLIPHPWNFTGITAMAIFSGLVFKNSKYFVLAPMVALFISDLIIGFHNTMIFTYLGFSVVGFLSLLTFNHSSFSKIEGKAKSYGLYGALSLVGSLLFFLISNFGVWFSSAMYEKSFLGLTQCLVAGLPFLENQITGDLFYTAVMGFALSPLKMKSEEVSLS